MTNENFLSLKMRLRCFLDLRCLFIFVVLTSASSQPGKSVTLSSHNHHTFFTIFMQSSHNCNTIIIQSLHNHHTVITQSSHSCHPIVTQSSHNHHTIVTHSSHSCHRNVLKMSYIATFRYFIGQLRLSISNFWFQEKTY